MKMVWDLITWWVPHEHPCIFNPAAMETGGINPNSTLTHRKRCFLGMIITTNLNWKSYSVSQTTSRIPGQSGHKRGSKVSCKERRNHPYAYPPVTSFHSRNSFDNECASNTRTNWTQIKGDGNKISLLLAWTYSNQLPILSSDRPRQSSQPLQPPASHCPPAGM